MQAFLPPTLKTGEPRNPIYGANSSGLADLMIENMDVGTVVSSEGDTDGNVFGFEKSRHYL